MTTINVSLPERLYPIHIGPGILDHPQLYSPHIRGSTVVVITNTTIEPLYADQLKSAISSIAEVKTFVLPDGETHKHLNTVNSIFDFMLAIPCDRQTTVVALGGGVVGDIAGFAASCYQRGVAYLQVPTTLLAQVDSSVGGKTGVNHPLGKNMIGAFHQPQCVIADTNTLTTLPDRELKAGLAEVIKYGAICDAEFFSWLELNIDSVLNRDAEKLAYVIERSCQNKSRVVEEDERESGIRAILNFGHTFGHAIEAWLNYEQWLHGEAVAVGMVIGAGFSARLKMIDTSQAERISALIERTGLPTRPPAGMSTDDFLELMKLDKKVQSNTIRLILLKQIGEAVITSEYPENELRSTLDAEISTP